MADVGGDTSNELQVPRPDSNSNVSNKSDESPSVPKQDKLAVKPPSPQPPSLAQSQTKSVHEFSSNPSTPM